MLGIVKRKLRVAYTRFNKWYYRLTCGSCRVLLYHRVTDLDADPQLLAVNPENFDAQLEFLSREYEVLKVAEFEDILEHGKRFPKNAILLTFDDGYADNCLEALPILERHGLQALFYISTGTLDTGEEYWWDAVERIILLAERPASENEMEIEGEIFSLDCSDGAARQELYEALLPKLRRMRSELRENVIRRLAGIFGREQPRESYRAMTHAELQTMESSDFAVLGAHTHLHPSLAALDRDGQHDEISRSKEILEAALGRKLTHFSYPFGSSNDYNDDTLAIVKDLGFEFVAANYPSVVNKHSERLQFPRFLVRDWDVDTFRKQLKSFV